MIVSFCDWDGFVNISCESLRLVCESLDLSRRVPDAVTADSEDPASVPIYWVSKWVDYSDKYGLGYQLCDNSVGVLFNDSTRLLLLANGEYVFLASWLHHNCVVIVVLVIIACSASTDNCVKCYLVWSVPSSMRMTKLLS